MSKLTHPSFEKFISNECNSLSIISRNIGSITGLNSLYSIIYQTSSIMTGQMKMKGGINIMDIHSEIDLVLQGKPCKGFIGARVARSEEPGEDDKFSECSYSFVISKNGKIIRKFHFDYADPSNETKTKVPLYHFQYGGKLSPHLDTAMYNMDEISDWLSEPRFSIYPMNIALFLDALFSEIQDRDILNLTQTKPWRKLIYDNEQFLYTPYFSTISEHISSGKHTSQFLLRELFYGQGLTSTNP